MFTQIAPLPLDKEAPTSDKKKSTRRSVRGEQVGHHAQQGPCEHLCACGRLRDECVRDTVWSLWASAEGGGTRPQA
jgi:hypothetical protein